MTLGKPLSCLGFISLLCKMTREPAYREGCQLRNDMTCTGIS